MRVAVVTDSASNLPSDVRERYRIPAVPMYLKFGEHQYRDGVDLPPGSFYERLAEEAETVSTAGPSVGDFGAAFESALGNADAVVCVTVASFVSVTHSSAVKAAEAFDGRVRVVDSASASMGEGFVALEAARAAEAGADLDTVEARARAVANGVQMIATINTFEFLRRSGRVHALLAYAGTALNIKPVFAFRGGAVEQVGRPRTRARAVERLAAEVREGAGDRPVHLAVVHADCAAEAGALLERLTGENRCAEAFTSEFTPLMGAHTGPGVLGVAFWS